MRLKNKKTGEIKEYGSVGAITFEKGGVLEGFSQFDSIKSFNEEWEDYEEPKASINVTGPVEKDDNTVLIEFYNHEEAEKAVEKLKAWKRLKDKGFEVELRPGIARGEIRYYVKEESNEVEQDLRICFGGEE